MKTNQVKDAMRQMCTKVLDASEGIVYRKLFDELEIRLTEEDFDSFLDELDERVTRHRQGRPEPVPAPPVKPVA